MTYSAHYPYGTHSTDADRFADEFLAALDVAPTDRIGPPRRRPIGKWLMWSVVLLGTASAAALHVDDPSRWPRWWSEAKTLAAPFIERMTAVATAATQSSDSRLGAQERLGSSEMPGTTAAAQPHPADAQSAPPADVQLDAVAEPLEKTIASAPPVAAVESTPIPSKRAAAEDPKRARAAAVGLNPEVSRVLLSRLSDADFRNAGVAIQKALAETPDDDVLYWPLKTKPGVAQFQVHFVPGADEGCRRYVVTIAKDGWATTALPMDNCTAMQTLAKAKSG